MESRGGGFRNTKVIFNYNYIIQAKDLPILLNTMTMDYYQGNFRLLIEGNLNERKEKCFNAF